jgi:hypothetical protein
MAAALTINKSEEDSAQLVSKQRCLEKSTNSVINTAAVDATRSPAARACIRLVAREHADPQLPLHLQQCIRTTFCFRREIQVTLFDS